MATTRLGQIGVGVEPYGTFSPKDAAPSTGPHNPGLITRLAQFGVGVSKYGTFAPKSEAAPEPQAEVQTQTPAGKSKGGRRRRYILPDGTHVLASLEEVLSLLELFKAVEVVKKPKGKPRQRVVKTPVVELVSWEPIRDFAHETFKPVYRERLIFKPDQKKLDLAIQRLKRIIDDEEAILVLLG